MIDIPTLTENERDVRSVLCPWRNVLRFAEPTAAGVPSISRNRRVVITCSPMEGRRSLLEILLPQIIEALDYDDVRRFFQPTLPTDIRVYGQDVAA